MASSNRIPALDAFRGFTVAAMLLVNNPGTWSAIYWPLEHAEWHGWTPTDLIFPFFLFIVGITTELAKKDTLGILRRGGLIILCGLLLNQFPYFNFATMRWTGVLQRIGIVYIIAALIAMRASRRVIIGIVIAILLGYWAVLSQGPLYPPDATIAAQVDRAFIPTAHMWKQSKTWDPEGVLSTIPAIATALLGILVAPWVKEKNLARLALFGAIATAVGLLWGLVFPINKNLWTSSYVVFTAGAACVILALWIWKLPAEPFRVFGMNPLIAFVGSGGMARILGITKWGAASYHKFYKPYFEPHLASLLWALTFVLFWYLVLWVLDRRRIYVRA
ncbi:MAG TPA: heparan-alpha-glucosaminide N-acetyltransferase domain-containing protein [Thermoanaerobaculia bacterium]